MEIQTEQLLEHRILLVLASNILNKDSYNISSKNGSPKISMGIRSGSSVFGSSYTPGPGNYNTISDHNSKSGVTMGAKYHSKTIN